MFVSGANYSKLKTNLRLVVSRLKLLEKKKTELAQKARREIADFIANGKLERARIRVEHIIREDYLVEAMELVEMYCDLLLARFGLIQQMKTLDEGLSEAVSSVIWVTPRLQADVAELKVVSEQLSIKYGKPYAQAARENTLQSVNEKLMAKLSVQAPPRVLVEKYLIEIAKSHNVPYEPDESVLKEDEMLAGDMIALANDSELIKFEDDEKNPNCFPGFPNVPNVPPGGRPPHNYGGGGGGGGMAASGNPSISLPQPMATPFNYPPPVNPPEKPPRGYDNIPTGPPPLPNVPPSGPYPDVSPPGPYSLPPAYDNIGSSTVPSYASVVSPNQTPVSASVFGATNYGNKAKPTDIDFMPELPSVPDNNLPGLDPPGTQSEDLDFDELTKRFEDLKKKK